MISNNTQIVRDGLILHIDANNLRSYTGPAVKNVLTRIIPTSIYDNGSTYRAFSGTEDVYVPELGHITGCNYADWYNDYNGGSGNCCPNMFDFGTSLPLVGSQEYTYAIVYRSVNRYTNPNLMYHYEYGPSGYITEFGLHNSGYSWQETHLGNGWYWSRAKFTTNASTTIGHFYTFMYQYATWNRLYVAKVALMPGDFTNLHPKYWPELGSTKAEFSVFNDLTGRNSLQASSLSYAADGTPSFNGSNSVILGGASSNYLPMQNFSLETWHKSPGVAAGMYTTSLWGLTYGITSNIYNDGSIVCNTYNSDTSSTFSSISYGGINLVNNNWHHVVYVVSTTESYLYIDGTLVATATNSGTWSGTNVWSAMELQIGNNPNNYFYRFNGQIPVAKIYNRALSTTEVQQNFNALRGRYGI